MEYRPIDPKKEYVARLETGADWREEIESLAQHEDVVAGWFTALGALQDANLWYYDQSEKTYQTHTFDEPLEVASCVGNISQLDGDLFAHTHAVLSRETGEALAGHLDGGTVFAGEVYLRAFNLKLVRTPHDQTGLDLWL